MEQYRVLIVEDSAFMRRAIGLIFEEDPQFYIVGTARNGIEALEKIEQYQPDVVTMDIEMPEMNGIEALQIIMKNNPVPVVMLSTLTGEGTEATLKALELGAVDFFLKGDLLKEDHTISDFLARVKVAARANVAKTLGIESTLVIDPLDAKVVEQESYASKAELVIIGCSAGGPSALQSVLPKFLPDFIPPVIVIQHISPGFTKPLAERFNLICNLTVKEAEDGDRLTSGYIYIAPAGYQTVLEKQPDGDVVLRIETSTLIKTLHRPSVDVTLHSAAPLYGDSLLTVILTGMGNDGLDGCKEVKRQGGQIIVEAEGSCLVYGMPRVVCEAGLADRQALLPYIYQHIVSYC